MHPFSMNARVGDKAVHDRQVWVVRQETSSFVPPMWQRDDNEIEANFLRPARCLG